jgi:hypothetical protein
MKTGVIRVTPNAGIYANTNEFYEYMSTLLGATMPNQLSIDGVLFPPIILDQKGVSHRLNETTERWDLLQTRNLIFDMMLAPDGSVTIDGVQLEVFTSGVTCAGTDPKSYDEQQDGPLLAAQCSVAKTIANRVSSESTSPTGPGQCRQLGLEHTGCIYLTELAQTSIETLDTSYLGPVSVQCGAIFPPNWPTAVEYCNFSLGSVIRPRVEMDSITMNSFFFYSLGAWLFMDTNLYESVQMTNRNKGVCTNSTAQYVNHYVYPKTKDGSYSTAEAQCQF